MSIDVCLSELRADMRVAVTIMSFIVFSIICHLDVYNPTTCIFMYLSKLPSVHKLIVCRNER